MHRNIFLSLILWVVEVVFVTALVSDDWMRSIQDTEDKMVVEFLGKEKDEEVRKQAQDWFDKIFVKTGAQQSVYHYFIPTEEERAASIGFQDVGRDNLFPYITSRLQTLWDSIYQAIRRFFFVLCWWPFMISAFIPFIIDGLVKRKVKQSNFDYSSPLVHRYSFLFSVGVLYVLMLGLTFPFPVPPQIMPLTWIGMALALNGYLANTQKRI
jgi:hypothetical protein